MHQIYKTYNKNALILNPICIQFFYRSDQPPLGPGLQSPATLLFNHPIRGIMLILSRLLISTKNNDEHYEALVKRQKKNKSHDTSRNYNFIPIESAVEVQQKDGGSLTHGTIIQNIDNNHNISCTICVTKTGWLINKNGKNVKTTQITAEQYLWHQVDKHRKIDPVEDFLKQF